MRISDWSSDVCSSDLASFSPCPTCRQYSHSIGEAQHNQAYMHFQSMIAHPVRGHPMANAFDDQTRDAAEVLMASISTLVDTLKSAREYVSEAVDANGGIDGCEIHYRHDLETIANALAKFGVARTVPVYALSENNPPGVQLSAEAPRTRKTRPHGQTNTT